MPPSITPGQRKQIIRLVEDGLDSSGLSQEGAQRVIERGGEMQDELHQILCEFSVNGRFADEEVESNYGYLSGYRVPKSIVDQIEILLAHWPQLNPDGAVRYMREYPKLQLPGWVEGPFALIRPGFFSDIYGEEVEEVLRALKKARDDEFVNYRTGKLGPEYLRQTVRTVVAIKRIMEQQPNGDIIVVPEQFGFRHRGRSVRRVREVITGSSEFGVGAFAGGIMLLTHPERLVSYDDLWIDFAGDEYAPDADGDFSRALCSYFDNKVKFATRPVDSPHDDYGSASGFLPAVEGLNSRIF